MILPGSYANGFAPRDGQPLYPELWRGCVGAWAPCLGPTGLTLRDWSRYENHGTLTNMSIAACWAPSSGKTSMLFDGSNDYVQTSLTAIGATHTFSCWFNASSLATTQVVLEKFSGSTVEDNIFLQGTSLSSYRSGFYSTFTLSSGVWYHAVLTATATTMQHWLNGVAAAPATQAYSATAGPVVIGSRSGTFSFGGSVDDVLIYNRILSASEIALLSRRRGIAYELVPRRRASSAVSFNRRRRLLVGASS